MDYSNLFFCLCHIRYTFL